MRQFWDKFSVANLFFLGLCFLWFAVLVLVYYIFHLDLGWSLFVQAWKFVINPSLGLFFVGVIISFIQSKLTVRNKNSGKTRLDNGTAP